MAARKLTDEEVQRAIILIASGRTQKETARILGISQPALCTRIAKYKRGPQGRRATVTLSPEQRAQIPEMRGRGWSYKRIAHEFGCTRQAIHLQLRGQREQEKEVEKEDKELQKIVDAIDQRERRLKEDRTKRAAEQAKIKYNSQADEDDDHLSQLW
jgi:predicted transcriptional regulator